MAKRSTKRTLAARNTNEVTQTADLAFWGFQTISPTGQAPKSRVPTANAAFDIAFQLRADNQARENRWARVLKCYKGFPPNEYSAVIAKGFQGQSNVPFRQMTFILDNQKSSFIDMVTERNLAANIITKKGNEKEKKIWSELISIAFDRVLRKWKSYLYNVEQDLEEMMIAGKGFEIAEDMSGWPTKSFHNSDVLIPDRTYADFSNLGEMCIKRSYTPLEFWRKVTGGETDVDKAEAHAHNAGWNFWACVDAMRLRTTNYSTLWSPTEWLRQVAAGSFNLSRLYNLRIDLFELLVKEFDGSITKCSVLQNYGPILESYTQGTFKEQFKGFTEEEYRTKTGFLYCKPNFVPKRDNTDYSGWDEVICPITDSVGSGLWHEIQGLGERIFIQCRQYDINMNRAMDAININASLWLKGNTTDATQKMKNMEWNPWMILPQDVNPVQIRMNVPIADIFAGMQYYQADLYRGIGAYRIHADTKSGKERTRGEAELDAAEDAKLSGTQIKRYNENQGAWQKMLYRRLVNTKAGGNGYDLKQEFEAFLEENKVPKEAWAYENIEDIQSNLLGGAGSASMKLMIAEKTVMLAGMSAATPGQENAICDAIAALNYRQNVKRYRPDVPAQLPDQDRVIGSENSILTDPLANIENARVHPTDNHIDHLKGHYSNMMFDLNQGMQMMQPGMADKKELMGKVVSLNNQGGHSMAHMQFLARDESKKDIIKQFDKAFSELQGQVAKFEKNVSDMPDEQEGQQGMSPEDIKLQAMAAESAIKVNTLKQTSDIKMAAKVQDHELKQQIKKDQAATGIATTRAKTANQIELDRQKAEQQRKDEEMKAPEKTNE